MKENEKKNTEKDSRAEIRETLRKMGMLSPYYREDDEDE